MTSPIPPESAVPFIDAARDVTVLPPPMEAQFKRWVKANKIPDVDHPQSFYDYRGFWLANGGRGVTWGKQHFPDTFKQHGHPTFSMESQYSKGFGDGGMWVRGSYLPQAHVRLLAALLGIPQ